MKKITCLLAILCSLTIYAQGKVAQKVQVLVSEKASFRDFSPLTVNSNPGNRSDNVVKNATYATIDNAMVKAIAASRPETIELDIPYNGSVVTVQLYRTRPFTQGFHVDTDRQKNISYRAGAHYRGIVKNNAASVASFSFSHSGVMNGLISSPELNNLVVGRLQKKKNIKDYIIYSDANLNVMNTFGCVTPDPEHSEHADNEKGMLSTQSDKCINIYFELDHQLYLANDSSTDMATDWISSVFNNIQTLYENDGISVGFSSFFIWTTPDPYSGDESDDYLMEFQDIANFDGDVGQLIGIDQGGLGGLAFISGLCNENNVSYVDVDLEFEEVPVFSWTVEAMTHELGHQFGSPHTHACAWNGNNTAIDGCGTQAGFIEGPCAMGPMPVSQKGTIMSYCHLTNVGINLANGFGPQPTTRMLNFINSSTCLGTDCEALCENPITAFSVSESDSSSVTVDWDGESTGVWEVAVRPYSNTATNWEQVPASNVTINDLEPNKYYSVSVRQTCVGGISENREVIFGTDADWCEGQELTDVGGADANYGNNQVITRTLIPETGKAIKVDFTEFNLDTEGEGDYLFIYAGLDNTAPMIGTYTGTTLPGSITSTAANGALTFEFMSDGSGTASGWRANVTCEMLAGLEETVFSQFSYYPNPSGGIVNVEAGSSIDEVLVYNVAGQLLYTKKVNSAKTTVDISSFAEGVYFFKAVSGSKEMNFRIVKQNK